MLLKTCQKTTSPRAHCPENAMAVNAIAAATVATRAADVILPAIQKFMATPDTIIDGK